jgi:hypothetical protein
LNLVLLFDAWVLPDHAVAGKAIESLLPGAVEFLERTVGAPASGKVGE